MRQNTSASTGILTKQSPKPLCDYSTKKNLPMKFPMVSHGLLLCMLSTASTWAASPQGAALCISHTMLRLIQSQGGRRMFPFPLQQLNSRQVQEPTKVAGEMGSLLVQGCFQNHRNADYSNLLTADLAQISCGCVLSNLENLQGQRLPPFLWVPLPGLCYLSGCSLHRLPLLMLTTTIEKSLTDIFLTPLRVVVGCIQIPFTEELKKPLLSQAGLQLNFPIFLCNRIVCS